MSVYESIMQGLTEAVDYQQGKINARKTRLTIKPVDTFNNNDIKRIRQKTGLYLSIMAYPVSAVFFCGVEGAIGDGNKGVC